MFWGFVAFGGYTTVEFSYGLGIVDLTHTRLVRASTARSLTPFAVAVLAGIVLSVDPPRVRAAGRAGRRRSRSNRS